MNDTHKQAAFVLTQSSDLFGNFMAEKPYLPKGRLSRWNVFRHFFCHVEDRVGSADRTAYHMRKCGPQTKERWKREYRLERMNSPKCCWPI